MTFEQITPQQNSLSLLQVGMRFVLDFNLLNGNKYQATARLIGYKKDEFILIDFPISRETDFERTFLENTEVVLRAVTNTSFRDIVAFRTTINTIVYRPIKMLSLNMPASITNHKIRQQPRITTNCLVTLIGDNLSLPAIMLDYSLCGCCVSVSVINDTGIVIGDKLAIQYSLPTISGHLNAYVVNMHVSQDDCKIGIQFVEQNLEFKKEIFNYCMIEIYSNATLTNS